MPTSALDDAKLTNALNSDSTAVSNLFLTTQNGIGKRIPDTVDSFLQAVTGSLTARQDGISTTIAGIDKKIDREEQRIAALEQNLVR